MLLKIDVPRAEDIIYNKNGRIIVKVRRYGQFASAAHLNTIDGETLEDFEANKAKSGKTVFVGGKGGITIG